MVAASSSLPKAMLRAGIQSGSIMAAADTVTQLQIEHRSTWDARRTTRWATAGLFLHGPYFCAGFVQIDRYFGMATSFSNVIKKTLTAQIVLFGPYLAMLFGFLGWMEGHPNIQQKVQQQVPDAFIVGAFYWPVANSLNFALVPPSLRVPYLATAAGLWNGYLSWSNARQG